jgi:hypothetical protein
VTPDRRESSEARAVLVVRADPRREECRPLRFVLQSACKAQPIEHTGLLVEPLTDLLC